ncbi:MAG: cyclic nucleotide-binding domain-containing protein, partial [Actinomycetota bacterium]
MSQQADVVDSLAGMALFADLTSPQLEAVAHTFEEEFFDEGTRVLRKGFAGSGFYLIIEGEAAVRLDGKEIATLSRGDFFGEISALLNELPTADVIATRPLRCAVLSSEAMDGFLLSHPSVALRMLKAQARRLRTNNR